ncbi:natural cytotoxicity triggering receptor 3-like isoform X1 [Ambystoma mexicanum]|uniref:natural cytotoxicity triggering receptor 3-like isoform X1 n=1 Tax=Ambystoma mexicanum TaxID=8296 RepID=UPI0037E740F3
MKPRARDCFLGVMNWLCLVLLLKIKPGTSTLLTISQTPTVCATVGSTAKLDCSFSYNEVSKTKRGHYNWLKAPEDLVDNAIEKYHGRIMKSNTNGTLFFTNKRADIELLNVTQEDSGLYYCNVTIVDIGSGKGGGTQLNVQDKCPSQVPYSMTYLAIIARTAATFLLLLGIIKLLKCCCKKKKSTGGNKGRSQKQLEMHTVSQIKNETLSDPYALLGFGQDTYGIQPFQLNPEAFVYPEIGE